MSNANPKPYNPNWSYLAIALMILLCLFADSIFESLFGF